MRSRDRGPRLVGDAPGQPQEALSCNVLLGLELVNDKLLQGGGLCSGLCVSLLYFLREQKSAVAHMLVGGPGR